MEEYVNRHFVKSITIDMLFNHVRNIGLCAILMGIGFIMFSVEYEAYKMPFLSQKAVSVFVIGVSVVLTVLNSLQLALSVMTAISSISRWVSFIVVLLLTLWLQVTVYYIINVQAITIVKSYSGA